MLRLKERERERKVVSGGRRVRRREKMKRKRHARGDKKYDKATSNTEI